MEKRFRAPFSPRSSQNQPLRKRFVIICEGARTETDYFRHLREKWRRRFKKVDDHVSIEIRGPEEAGGNMPPNLVEHAIETLRIIGEKEKKRWDPRSQVWCVFDVEAEGRVANLINIVKKAKQQKIRLAISNPCFELWFYLHYRYCDAAVPDGKAMKQLLKKCWPDYKKNAGEFSHLDGLYETAKRHAIRLRNASHIDRPPSDPVPRPYTDVDELITEIEAVLADLR